MAGVRPNSLVNGRIADSYLEHIRIAVEARDAGAPFRDFIDNWAAFSSDTNHHRSAGNRPKWFNNPDATRRMAMLKTLRFRSVAADEILSLATKTPAEYRARVKEGDTGVRLIVDHAVPIAVIVEHLFTQAADLTTDRIRSVLERWYCLGLLTIADNGKLNTGSLGSKMPPEWHGVDVFARYKQAGIVAYLDQPVPS